METETVTTTRFNPLSGYIRKQLTPPISYHSVKPGFTIANGTGSKLLMNTPTLHTATTFHFETTPNFSASTVINNMAKVSLPSEEKPAENRKSYLQTFSSFLTPLRDILTSFARRIQQQSGSTEDLFYDAEDDLPPQYESLFDMDGMDSFVSAVQHCEFEKQVPEFFDLSPEELKLNFAIKGDDKSALNVVVPEVVDSLATPTEEKGNKTEDDAVELDSDCLEISSKTQQTHLVETLPERPPPSKTMRIRRNRRQRKRENKSTNGKINNLELCKRRCASANSSFNPKSLNHKSKLTLHKNQTDKKRHAIESDIHNDLEMLSVSTSVDEVFDDLDEEFVVAEKISENLGKDDDDDTDIAIDQVISFNVDDFPAIEPPPSRNRWQGVSKNICNTIHQRFRCKPTAASPSKRTRQVSDCDSEDSFIVFARDSPITSPSTEDSPLATATTTTTASVQSPLQFNGTTSDICYLRRPFTPRRSVVRHLSECSDDSFICFEEDPRGDASPSTLGAQYSETDSDTDDYSSTDADETDEDEDDDAENDENEEDEEEEETVTRKTNQFVDSDSDDEEVTNNQPDSGFEEKKVSFNLNPKVHVMHTWDFAYRQARKGTWERFALDRCRFANRVRALEPVLSPVFNGEHRRRVFQSRFKEDGQLQHN